MWADIRQSWRHLRRRRLFGGLVVLLLAMGICANLVVFSFVNALLLRPLAVRAPGELFLLQKMRLRQVRPDTSFDYRQFTLLRRAGGFRVAAEQEWSRLNFQPFERDGLVRLATVQMVSPNYFSELGVGAAAGRVLTEEDAAAAGQIPAVLSYQFWQSAFGGNRAAIGSVVRIRKYPFVVVGVLPRDFHGLDIERAPDFRVPIGAAAELLGHAVTAPGDPRAGFLIVARLARGAAPLSVAAQITARVQPGEAAILREWYAHAAANWPAWTIEQDIQSQSQYKVALRPVGRGLSALRDDLSGALVLLLGGVALLLGAVCASVAGLVIAESEERRHEIALRLSLGASRGRLLRQLLAEHGLLALAAAALGCGAAYACFPLAARLLPVARVSVRYLTPRLVDARMDGPALLFALGLAAASVLLFGLLPGWRAARAELYVELKGSGRSVTSAVSGFGPVALRVALRVVMLTAAVLLIRTFRKLDSLNPGFDRRHVLAITADLEDARDAGGDSPAVLARTLREQVKAIPGVREVSYTELGLMRGMGQKMTVAPQGVALPASTFLNTTVTAVSPGYFATLGIALQDGRNLAASDAGRKPEPIVVNRAFASAFFPRQNAIGKGIVYATDGRHPPDAVIVGIVGTAKYRSLREPDPPAQYRLFDEAKDIDGPLLMYIRADSDAASLLAAVRRALRGVPIVEAATLEQEVQNTLWRERLLALLGGFFGAVCWLLAGMGLYGSLARFVARRQRELGIRVALGARRTQILRTVGARVLWPVGVGLAAGLLASVWLAGYTRPMLFGVTPGDGLSYALSGGGVLLCALVAALRPGWRAARTDPAAALREE